MDRRHAQITAIAVAIYVLIGCTGGAPGNESGSHAAGLLAQDLLPDASLTTAMSAAQQVLAQSGVAITEVGNAVIQAIEPSTGSTLSRFEVLQLVNDARSSASRGRIDVKTLGQMLDEFGWPYAEDQSREAQTLALLRLWVTTAQQEPDRPESFGATFVAETVKLRNSSGDLTNEQTAAGDVSLSLLDTITLTSWFNRGETEVLADAGDPCTTLRKSMGAGWGDAAHASANEARRRLIQLATQAVPNSQTFGQAIQAMRLLDRLARLVLFYNSAAISIEILSDSSLHKPLDSDVLLSSFRATVGVSDADWDLYLDGRGADGVQAESAINDCLDFLGLPAPANLGRLASAIDDWRVEWTAITGMPEHAYIEAAVSEFDINGQLQHNVTRISDHTAQTKPLVVRILPETEEVHKGDGALIVAPVTVRAELESSSRPTLQTLINATRGLFGLTSALAELMSGWVLEISQPAAYATLSVEYHESGTARFTFTVNTTLVNHHPNPVAHAQEYGSYAEHNYTESMEGLLECQPPTTANLNWDCTAEATGSASGSIDVWDDNGLLECSVNSWYVGPITATSTGSTDTLDVMTLEPSDIDNEVPIGCDETHSLVLPRRNWSLPPVGKTVSQDFGSYVTPWNLSYSRTLTITREH